MPKNVPINSIKIAAESNQILHLLILTFRNRPIFSNRFTALCVQTQFRHKNCHFFVTYFGDGDSQFNKLSQVSEPRNLSQSFFPQLGPVFFLRGSGYHLVKNFSQLFLAWTQIDVCTNSKLMNSVVLQCLLKRF